MDRIQSYNVGGWSYIKKLKEFTDGKYKDFDFVDHVSVSQFIALYFLFDEA